MLGENSSETCILIHWGEILSPETMGHRIVEHIKNNPDVAVFKLIIQERRRNQRTPEGNDL